MIKKKNLKSKTFTKDDQYHKVENKAWDKDNQAWWDWYVSLADNSDSSIKNNLLELPVDIFEDVVDVGEHGFDDLESDFLTKDMHGSGYDVLGLINTHNVTNFYDDNNDVANHLFDLF